MSSNGAGASNYNHLLIYNNFLAPGVQAQIQMQMIARSFIASRISI